MIQNLTKYPKYAVALSFATGLFAPWIFNKLKNTLSTLNKNKNKSQRLYVGIELGGTNYSVGVAAPNYDQNGKIVCFTLKKHITNRTDQNCQTTIKEIIDYLGKEQYYFIGICSFGPLCLDANSENFGKITSTPKLTWKNYPVLQKIRQGTNSKKYGFDTDVNAPAYAQFVLGNHGVKQSLIYVTVGTGVGIGVIANGKTIHGLVHPEGGHIIVRRHDDQDKKFRGVCPYHQQCLQGYVTNHSIAKRLKIDIHSLHTLDDNNEVWKLIGYYLAQLCMNLTLILSPQAIIIGGGIMNRKIIFTHIHRQFIKLLNEYVDHQKLKLRSIENYIKQPKIANVGLIGAMMLNSIDKQI